MAGDRASDAAGSLRPARLPPGRHTLSREFVGASQRERLLSAFAHLVSERGYHETTIAAIASTAAVSRRTLYSNFAGKEDLFLVALDLFSDHLTAVARSAAKPHREWPQKLIEALDALLRELEASPDYARLCLIEATAAGPALAARYREQLLDLCAALRPGRALRPSGAPISDSAEQALIGGAVALIAERIAAGEIESLAALLPDLAEFLLTPYLGGESAASLARGLSQLPDLPQS